MLVIYIKEECADKSMAAKHQIEEGCLKQAINSQTCRLSINGGIDAGYPSRLWYAYWRHSDRRVIIPMQLVILAEWLC